MISHNHRQPNSGQTRLRAERSAIHAAMPAEPDYLKLRQRREEVTEHLEELRTGTGRYTNTPIGQAAQDCVAAEHGLQRATRHAARQELSRWQRRKANHLVEQHQDALGQTRETWLSIGPPIEDDLTTQLKELDNAQAQLNVERLQHRAWLLEHPTALERLAGLEREVQRIGLHSGLTNLSLIHL